MVAVKPRKSGGDKPWKWWWWNRDNGGDEVEEMVAVRPRKVVAISCRNGGDETEGSGFYKQSMVLEKNFGGDSAINCCVMHRIYVWLMF